MTSTMAIDQYGQRMDDLGQHPRKELLARLGRQHASKMYCDTKDGKTKHIGYVIAGRWFRIFTVSDWPTGQAKAEGVGA